MRACLRVMALTAVVAMGTAFALPIITAPFSDHYTLVDLGPPPSGMGPSMLVSNTDPDILLVPSGGVINAVGVTRDAVTGHITGFTGSSSFFATLTIHGADDMAWAPNGTLLFVQPDSSLAEIEPGSTSPDKTVNAPLDTFGGGGGGLAFVPAGFGGAGSFVMTSYGNGNICTAPLTPDGSGTYDLGACSSSIHLSIDAWGLEGVVYLPLSSPLLNATSMLVADYRVGTVSAYTVGADGLPVPSSRQDFMTGFSGYGATIDPVTGDFLISDWSDRTFLEVQGFSPEPGTLTLLCGALASLVVLRRRRRSR